MEDAFLLSQLESRSDKRATLVTRLVSPRFAASIPSRPPTFAIYDFNSTHPLALDVDALEFSARRLSAPYRRDTLLLGTENRYRCPFCVRYDGDCSSSFPDKPPIDRLDLRRWSSTRSAAIAPSRCSKWKGERVQSSELGLAGQRKYGLIKRGTCGGICELISKIRARSRSTLTVQIER